MTIRERIADLITGGALSKAQYRAARWEAVAKSWEEQTWKLIDEKIDRAGGNA